MKKIKDIIKKNPEPARGTNYKDPSQLGQYSATNQVSESASLNQYLQAKGINPQYVSRDTKIAHSKSNEYLTWKKSHMNEDMTTQRPDGDARSLDAHSPTLRRQKSLKQVANHYTIKPVTTHKPQVPIKKEGSQTPQLTPEETVNEVSMDNLSPAKQAHVKKGRTATINLGTKSTENKPKVNKVQPKKHGFLRSILAGEEVKKPMSALDKFRKAAAERAKKHAETEKNSGGMTAAIDRLQKHLNKEDVSPLLKSIQKKSDTVHDKDIDKFVKGHKKGKLIPTKEEVEQIDELKKSTVFSWLKKQPVVPERKPGMDKKAHNQRIKTHTKSWNRALDRLSGYKPTSEDVGDAKAATNADGLPNAQLEPVSEKKRQMSKSARLIKALYKKKRMVKEDMYDHEKEDKSVVTYGKKPKHEKADEKDSKGEKKPQAAAVLTGGTTLTGEKRDDIEIDPMMRNRPGQPDVTKKDDKDKKKEDSKKDK